MLTSLCFTVYLQSWNALLKDHRLNDELVTKWSWLTSLFHHNFIESSYFGDVFLDRNPLATLNTQYITLGGVSTMKTKKSSWTLDQKLSLKRYQYWSYIGLIFNVRVSVIDHLENVCLGKLNFMLLIYMLKLVC